MATSGSRTVRSYSHVVSGSPQEVFPLLCPIREREWIPGWESKVVYSDSGIAEQDGIFVAGLQGSGRATFFVLRYEPPRHIEYLILDDRDLADMLSLTLEDRGDGSTTLHWRRVYTGLTREGRARVDAAAQAFAARVPRLAALLDEHLRRTR